VNTYNFVVEVNEFFLGGGGASVTLAFRVSRECGPRQRVKAVLRLMAEPSTTGPFRVV